MANKENNFNDVLRDAALDRSLGNMGEQQDSEESGKSVGTGPLRNDGTLVGSGAQEVLNASVFLGQVGFDRDRFSYGEEEQSWAVQFAQDEAANGNDLMDELQKMYEHPVMEDTAGFNGAAFRSFADGQAPADTKNLMTDQQASIVYNHRDEIRNNNGVLDLKNLTASEQEIMQPAVVLSQWASNDEASGIGYLTDDRYGNFIRNPLNDSGASGTAPKDSTDLRTNRENPGAQNQTFQGRPDQNRSNQNMPNMGQGHPESAWNAFSPDIPGMNRTGEPGPGVPSDYRPNFTMPGETSTQYRRGSVPPGNVPPVSGVRPIRGYSAAENYVKQNNITTIQFSDRQMDILSKHGQDLRNFDNQRTEGAQIWNEIKNGLDAPSVHYKNQYLHTLGKKESELSAEEVRGLHNYIVTSALTDKLSRKDAKIEAKNEAEFKVRARHGLGNVDLEKSEFAGEWKDKTKELKHEKLSANRKAYDPNFSNVPLYQGMKDLLTKKEKEGLIRSDKYGVDLTSQHMIQNRHGERAMNRKIILEQTQNGATNYTGQEMTDFARKTRTAKRARDAAETATDYLRKWKAEDALKAYDKRAQKLSDLKVDTESTAKQIEDLKKKNHLTDSEKNLLERLERKQDSNRDLTASMTKRRAKRGEFGEADAKGKTATDKKREALEQARDRANKLARVHQEKHTAVRNRQFADLAQSKGLRSIHAEEELLKQDKKKIRETNRASSREVLEYKAKAGSKRAESRLSRMEKRDTKRAERDKKRRKTRPTSAIKNLRGKRTELRDKVEGKLASAESYAFRFRDKIYHNRVAAWIDYYNPLSRLQKRVRRLGNKIKKRLFGWAQPFIEWLIRYIALPVGLVLIAVMVISSISVMIPMAIGGSDQTTKNLENEDGIAPGYYQATVTALQDYQKSYLNYYSDAAKSSAQSQADAIAQKYPGYLGGNTVKVDDAQIRSVVNEYGENSSDLSDTIQALTMARVRFLGTTLGDDNEIPKDTITNMALYMTALWVGDENNSYIKGLASKYGGTSGLNHQIVVNPAYNDTSGNTNAIHSSQGGITDSEGNQYSYLYTNYGELDDSTRAVCDNIWYRDANGNLSQTPSDITWSMDTYNNTGGSGKKPSDLKIGNAKIKSAAVTYEDEQQSEVPDDKVTPRSLKSGVRTIPMSSIQSEDDNNGDHFFRVNDTNKASWRNVKSGDVVVLTTGKNTYVAVRIGLVTHKGKGKKYPAHMNYHYTAASRNDVVKSGKTTSIGSIPSPAKMGDTFTLEDEVEHKTKLEWNNNWKDSNTVYYSGSQVKFDSSTNSFVLANGSAIPMPNGNHRRSRITVTWQDGGRDGGRLVPEMDVFYVQDVQNLIKSDNWKTGDPLPETKSGGIFKKHKAQLETIFGKGFNPGKNNTYTLSFPAILDEDGDTDDAVSKLSGSQFWNDKNYDINSPWYSKDDRKAWLDQNRPDLSEDEKEVEADPNTYVSFVCDILGDRSDSYKDGTEFWDSFDVTVKQGSVNGTLSADQQGKIAGNISQGSADIAGINEALGGSIPPGVQAMTNYALSRVGQPYVWGGFTEQYADCSGFISCIWRSRGYDSRRYTTYTLIPMAQTWGANDRLPAGSVLVNDHHTVYVAGWNEKTNCYVVIEAMGKDYGIVVSDGTPGRKLRNTTQAALHAKFPYVITKYCSQ